ncbi:MAG: D-alanyl-D-alanine carboxypeptidase [Proteobacteria bacterium]|jgi:D-alanyl-D-alanine carboxypeptidase (penicillin-binding protein 5/6)|nr:D-alanyl-D-alanine carboxypeptidase [Pseudomonadota bacterium]
MLRLSLTALLLFTSFYSSAQNLLPRPPQINVTSYILVEPVTGKVLAEFNADDQIEPASMTKVMTGYIAADQLHRNLVRADDEVLISTKAWKMEGSRMFIEAGKRVSFEDLIKGVVIQSGNDASVAIAEYLGGTEEGFVDIMNAYAQSLGLNNTLFENSTGLPSSNHFSSARDLSIISANLINNFPEHYALYKEKSFTFNDIRQLNRNRLLWRDDSVDGIKTGHTESAGFCLISSAARGSMRLIAVVAGANSEDERFNASQRLLEYGFRFFVTQNLLESNEEVRSADVWGGKKDNVSLGLAKDLIVTVPRAELPSLKIDYTFNNNIEAPISKGDILGSLSVKSGDTVIANANLVALEEVEPKGFFGRLISKIIMWFLNLFNLG